MTGTWVLDDVAFGARLAAAWRHVLVVAAAVRRGRLQAQHPPQSRAARPQAVMIEVRGRPGAQPQQQLVLVLLREL